MEALPGRARKEGDEEVDVLKIFLHHIYEFFNTPSPNLKFSSTSLTSVATPVISVTSAATPGIPVTSSTLTTAISITSVALSYVLLLAQDGSGPSCPSLAITLWVQCGQQK